MTTWYLESMAVQAGKAKSQIKAKQPDETLQSELQDALTSKDVMSRVLERECRSNCCLSRKLELAEGFALIGTDLKAVVTPGRQVVARHSMGRSTASST